LELFNEAQKLGVTQEQLANLLGLERHRLSRWRTRREEGSLKDRLPEPRLAPHRLLSKEREVFLQLATREGVADVSIPVLCAYGSDLDLVHISPSSGYRILREAQLSEPRGRARNRKSLPRIDHDLAIAPNRIWCWDITALATYTGGLLIIFI